MTNESAEFDVTQIGEGLYRIVDVLGNHCYVVVGESRALLVDSCGGIGNLRACVEGITDLPVTVVLTHGHDDHLSGAYWYDEAYLSPLDGGERCWQLVEDHSGRIFEQVISEGIVTAETPFALRDGARPHELPVADGDGNPTVIRFSRKTKKQYVMAENAEGKSTGFTAFYNEESRTWEVASVEKASKTAKATKTAKTSKTSRAK